MVVSTMDGVTGSSTEDHVIAVVTINRIDITTIGVFRRDQIKRLAVVADDIAASTESKSRDNHCF